MQYTSVDDDVEVVPFCSCESKAKQPKRPCENHDLHIEQGPTWTES